MFYPSRMVSHTRRISRLAAESGGTEGELEIAKIEADILHDALSGRFKTTVMVDPYLTNYLVRHFREMGYRVDAITHNVIRISWGE